MSETTIYVRGSEAEVREALSHIPEVARGNGDIAKAMMRRCGFAALDFISKAFIVKARGGTDAAGERWKKLSPKTIAYSRRHPGVLFPGSKRAPYAPSWMLTSAQRERWWAIYRKARGTKPSGAAYHKGKEDGGHAARLAWSILKKEGAQTLIGTYGNTKVDILRSTGALYTTLSPAESIPTDQVFRVLPGEVIVGTNRKWAGVHHNGSKDGRIPQRRLWAEPRKWPMRWWSNITEQAKQGLLDIAIFLLKVKGN